MNNKVSVLIPARNEPFLQQTITDVLSKAAGEVEVLAVLDGFWPNPPLKDDPRLTTIHFTESRGMRGAITAAASAATGRYLMKSDAHCLFGPGWDEILKAECEDNWIVVPRRDRLDPENWCLQQTGKPPIDYHYLSWAFEKPDEIGMHGNVWNERAKERTDVLVDDEMSSQGSCWFMRARHWRRLGGMPEEGYGKFVQEFQQLGLKTWLGGGRVAVNKKTTYLHLHKGKARGRFYHITKNSMVRGAHWSADYWLNNRWPERKHDLEWLIDRFNPPGWPSDWQSQVREWELGPDGYMRRKERRAA
jgi:glycosyltransferase involved in cell wall biosynthesis